MHVGLMLNLVEGVELIATASTVREPPLHQRVPYSTFDSDTPALAFQTALQLSAHSR